MLEANNHFLEVPILMHRTGMHFGTFSDMKLKILVIQNLRLSAYSLPGEAGCLNSSTYIKEPHFFNFLTELLLGHWPLKAEIRICFRIWYGECTC